MNSQLSFDISPKELFELLQNSSIEPFLVDVREQSELEIAEFPSKFLHLPMSQFVIWSKNLSKLLPNDRLIVAICHSGVRSLNFVLWMQSQELNVEILNLQGGIDAWSVQIDPAIPRY